MIQKMLDEAVLACENEADALLEPLESDLLKQLDVEKKLYDLEMARKDLKYRLGQQAALLLMDNAGGKAPSQAAVDRLHEQMMQESEEYRTLLNNIADASFTAKAIANKVEFGRHKLRLIEGLLGRLQNV